MLTAVSLLAEMQVIKQDRRAIARKPRDAAAVRCCLKFADIHYKFKSSQAPKAGLQSYMGIPTQNRY